MNKILQVNKAYKPFIFPWADQIRQDHEGAHWTTQEVKNLGDDEVQFKTKLSSGQREFIVNILKMFTQSDVQVGKVYQEILIPKIKNNEVRCMYSSFVAREALHQEAYALLNDTLGLPDKIYSEFLTNPSLKKKYDILDIDPNDYTAKGDDERLAAIKEVAGKMVFLEGVSLFASFIMLMNFRRSESGGLMSGMCSVVDWSVRDENIHVKGHLALLNSIGRPNANVMKAFAQKVVEAEDEFIDFTFSNYDIPGLTKEEVKQYIRFLTDRRLIEMGIKGIYKVKTNPISWVDEVFLANKFGNFFESTITEYSKDSLTGDWMTEHDYASYT